MIIRIPMRFEGSKGDKMLYALFDGSATYSCINDEIVEELETLIPLHTPNAHDNGQRVYLYGDKLSGSS